jgi:PhzF family phenazine biosynthesis protein
VRQWTVDAFAAQPFRGNPACVVEPLVAWPEDSWMQALAAENNQAETAFLKPASDPARFELRWFTPALEVPLCGHATLAAGHVLLSELGLASDRVVFETRSGPLTVARAQSGYEMDFPAQPPQRIETPAGLAAALGAEPVEVWVSAYLVAILANEAIVRALKPDLAALEQVCGAATRGRGNVGVAALADPGRGYDVVDRFFAPGSGIPEDPTTGSLHTMLTPLFAGKLNRTRLAFHQAYPGRGGDLVCEDRGERVALAGHAVTVVESRLRFAGGARSGSPKTVITGWSAKRGMPGNP